MGWLGILAKIMPWGVVLENAPQALKAARGMLRKQGAAQAAGAQASQDAQAMERLRETLPEAEWQWLQALLHRVQALEQSDQQSLELMEQMAGQMAEGITALDGLRRAVRWLVRICAVLGVVLLGVLVYLART